jgi:hypothetical protein
MLYVHTGAKTATLKEIESTYRVPTLEELRAKRKGEGTGNRWKPMHHGELIRDIHSAAKDRGLTVAKESFALSEDTHSIYGFMQFDGVDNFGRKDMAPVLGFRHDNLQRFRLLGVSGSRVFVCDNGAIVGDFVFGFKTTSGNVDGMDVKIGEGLDTWERQIAQMAAFVQFLESAELSDDHADHLLMLGARGNCFAWNQLGKIDAEYREPRHEEFRPRNAWSLYNAATEIAKDWSVRNVERGLKGFPRVLASELGFKGLDALVEPAIGANGENLN